MNQIEQLKTKIQKTKTASFQYRIFLVTGAFNLRSEVAQQPWSILWVEGRSLCILAGLKVRQIFSLMVFAR